MTDRIIRTEIRDSDIFLRECAPSGKGRKSLFHALQALHRLEILAVNAYKYQIPCKDENLNRLLISAMVNEMSHVQDFQIQLYERGLRPSCLRFVFWMAGLLLGTGSRLAGRNAILKMGIWTETKAVRHYTELIDKIRWDEKTLQLLLRDRKDEEEHLFLWNRMSRHGRKLQNAKRE